MKLTKSQTQLVILGALVAVTLIVAAVFLIKPPVVVEEPYQPKTVDTRIPREALEDPQYRALRSNVDLPLVPGRMGRENPFEPF